jgi:hypothetical protein
LSSQHEIQPPQAYAASDNGVFARTIFQADAAAGTRIEVRDWKLPPGKQTTPITLPGAAFIEARSGSGTLQAGDQKQELQLGAIVPVSHNQSFTIANSSQFTMAMRVYVATRAAPERLSDSDSKVQAPPCCLPLR